MLCKSVSNCQQKRMVDRLELGWHWPVSSQLGNYPDEKPLKHYTKQGGQHTWVCFGLFGGPEKEETYPMGQYLYKGPSITRDAWPHSTWRPKVVSLRDGWQMIGRSTACLDCLLSKWSDSRSALPTDSHTSPQHSLISGGNDELVSNTADVRVEHHLWLDWTFIRRARCLSVNWRLTSE